jgi:adenylate kinase family enzyme
LRNARHVFSQVNVTRLRQVPGITYTVPLARISIIGPSGSGKTTLARELATRLQLPHLQLDAYVWGAGWVRRSEEDFIDAVTTATSADRWVVDGQYKAAHGLLSDRADAVVWLDVPRRVALPRVARRSLADFVTRRTLYNGNVQSLKGAVELLRWATSADAKIREVNTGLQERIASSVAFYRLRTAREVERFRAQIESGVVPFGRST